MTWRCYFFGHVWSGWARIGREDDDLGWYRWCRRCAHSEVK